MHAPSPSADICTSPCSWRKRCATIDTTSHPAANTLVHGRTASWVTTYFLKRPLSQLLRHEVLAKTACSCRARCNLHKVEWLHSAYALCTSTVCPGMSLRSGDTKGCQLDRRFKRARLCQVDIEVQRLLRHRDLHPAQAQPRSGLECRSMRPFAPCFCAVPSTAVDLHTSQRELLKLKCCNQAAGMLPVEALTSLLLGLMLWACTLPKPSKGGGQLASTAKGAVLLHVIVRACRLAAPGPSPAARVPCRMRRRWRWGSGLHRGCVCGSASQASLVSAGQHTTPSAPLLPPPAAPNAAHWPKIYSRFLK